VVGGKSGRKAACRFSGDLELSGPGTAFPGKQVVEAIDRMIGDSADYISEPGLGTDVFEATSLDERVQDRGAPSAGVGTGKQTILAAKGQRTDRAFGGSGW